MGLFSLFYLILFLTIWRQEILSYLILSYLILLFGCKSENKKNCSGQHANTLHLSSGSGGLPPTGLADVGCSPPARRRGTGELGVPLQAAPAAAAALPDLPACRPPAGACTCRFYACRFSLSAPRNRPQVGFYACISLMSQPRDVSILHTRHEP